MKFLIVLVILIILLLAWVMFTPFILRIDSESSKMSVQIRGLGTVSVHWSAFEPILTIHIWGIKKSFYPYRWTKKSAAKEKKKEKTSKTIVSKRFTFHRLRRMFRTFEVQEFHLDLDTEDVILNAYLFPVFYFLNRGQYKVHINYNQRFLFRVKVQNQMYKLLYVWLR